VFPKIIRYIKGLDSINFYRGFIQAEKHRIPVRMMKLEKYVNQRYKGQIEKIDGIVHTTENTIFDLLCQQLD